MFGERSEFPTIHKRKQHAYTPNTSRHACMHTRTRNSANDLSHVTRARPSRRTDQRGRRVRCRGRSTTRTTTHILRCRRCRAHVFLMRFAPSVCVCVRAPSSPSHSLRARPTRRKRPRQRAHRPVCDLGSFAAAAAAALVDGMPLHCSREIPRDSLAAGRTTRHHGIKYTHARARATIQSHTLTLCERAHERVAFFA